MRKTTILIALSAILATASISFAQTDKPLKGQSISIFAAATGIDETFAEFTKDTGIKVNYLEMSSGEVLTRLRASKGKNLADAWFGGGVDSFMVAGQEGFLESYVSPEAEKIPEEYRDPDGFWTGLSLVAVDFIVNEDILREKGISAPKSWIDLGKPEYKGEVMMSNPTISGTNYSVIFEILEIFGEEKGWEVIRNIDANIPFYTKRGSAPPNKAAMGEVAIGIDPYDVGVKLIAQGHPVISVFPEEGTPGSLAPVAIMKGAKNVEAAKAFVDWCLSKRGQEVQMANTAKVGTRPDAEVPEYLRGLKDAKIILVDPIKSGERREEILGRWQKEFGEKTE
ncbi:MULTISPECIES: ABC transporter substrate-binding protein [Dethiosulfovibrio]|uniref:ABC transporter substrate-binding protein n=2 Tax=Dethiosulfovibrio TaxID=47054 RepID=A0ABS9EN96_9BACT|nr:MULTISPECIES: ABC transporter substrate-binding protein [Dethiosulfovibrio]MCF4114148.1 ABC transporter substrate-binding protein [Dethiosulfovibrio russensis]MCF4142662.1 ABC transporter substrate-binding protein [Dethiosulfovibrio marinus]MCF4145181.1 ABC transporter substrate-binding protein [Dethiosulfovibrio acidaminovorans]MEA3284950.1 ABC transporter substrate-binding protein [Synergistota bacterium]